MLLCWCVCRSRCARHSENDKGDKSVAIGAPTPAAAAGAAGAAAGAATGSSISAPRNVQSASMGSLDAIKEQALRLRELQSKLGFEKDQVRRVGGRRGWCWQ